MSATAYPINIVILDFSTGHQRNTIDSYRFNALLTPRAKPLAVKRKPISKKR